MLGLACQDSLNMRCSSCKPPPPSPARLGHQGHPPPRSPCAAVASSSTVLPLQSSGWSRRTISAPISSFRASGSRRSGMRKHVSSRHMSSELRAGLLGGPPPAGIREALAIVPRGALPILPLSMGDRALVLFPHMHRGCRMVASVQGSPQV